MNLLCRLGRHAPAGIPRWNDGYYFAICRRCRCDIVRTAYEGWRVPSGYRVVWSATPPEDREPVRLAPAPPPPPEPPQSAAPAEPETPPAKPVEIPQAAPPAGAGLPIDAVLARLRESEAAGEAPPLPPPAPAPDAAAVAQPPAPPRRHSWDFMDEEPSGGEWPAPRAEKAPAAGAMAAPTVMPPREVAQAPRRARSPGPWLRKRVPGAWSAVSRRLALREALPWMIPAAAFAVAAIAILAVTLAEPDGAPLPSPDAANVEAAPMPEEVVNAPPPSQGRPAFVTASVLSCRSAPARQARRVRNLGHGDTVEVLAREGEWISVAHRGAQCWTLARFVAEQRPL